MLDMQTMAKAVADVATNLTNVVGLIEKNIQSYDRIRDRNREHRFKDGLEAILVSLTRWHGSNLTTLWLLARWSDNDDSLTNQSSFLDVRHSYETELTAFLNAISDTMQLLEQYQVDVIRLDHKLYQ